MFNVCPSCGIYRDDKVIDERGLWAVCPQCGHRQRFLRQPLFILSGASGSGKSTVCLALTGTLPEVVVLESDILWAEEFVAREKWPKYFNLWLRMAKNIGQSGKPVLLVGAGLGVPDNTESCVERRYLGPIQRLALVCHEADLVQRLRARPAWRGCDDPGFVADHVRYNRWFVEEACHLSPPVDLYDTTGRSVNETADFVRGWVRGKL